MNIKNAHVVIRLHTTLIECDLLNGNVFLSLAYTLRERC